AGRRTEPIVDSGGKPSELVLDSDPFEDGGFGLATQFMPPIHDASSLRELREAIGVRGGLGLAVLQAEFDQVRLRFRAPKEEVAAAAQLRHQIGLLNLYQGHYSEAAACFQNALELGRPRDIAELDRARRSALLGIVALRQGELDNGPGSLDQSSGIFPIAPAA